MMAIYTPAMGREESCTEESVSAEVAAWEAALVHHVPREGLSASLYGVLARRDPERADHWIEMAFNLEHAPSAAAYWLREFGDQDLFLSQHSFRRPERRERSLSTLNLTALDLDAEKALGVGVDMEKVLEEVLVKLEELGIPAPSYVVASGHGLHLKWLYYTPIPAKARSRWAAVNKHLCTALAPWGADTNAVKTTQVMRMVGSANYKGVACQVRLAWVNGSSSAPSCVDFDEFAAAVLPVPREERRAANRAKSAHARRCAALAQEFAANRAEVHRLDQAEGRCTHGYGAGVPSELTPEALGSVSRPSATARLAEAESIHSQRLKKLETAIQHVCGGQVPHGQRNGVAWLAAWCIAWVACARGQVDALGQVDAWCKRWIPTFTTREVRASARSVLSRAAHPAATVDPVRGLYRMSEPRFRRAIADALALEETHPILTARNGSACGVAGQKVKHRGKMLEAYAMESIKGLSPVAFREERRRRQQLGGVYAAAQRTKARSADIAQAVEMAAAGMSGVQIAKAKGVSPATVSRWLNAPPATTFTLHVRRAAPFGLAQVAVRAVRGISNGVTYGVPPHFAAPVTGGNCVGTRPESLTIDTTGPKPDGPSVKTSARGVGIGAPAVTTTGRRQLQPSVAERVRAGIRTASDWEPWICLWDFRNPVHRGSRSSVLGFAPKGPTQDRSPGNLNMRGQQHESHARTGFPRQAPSVKTASRATGPNKGAKVGHHKRGRLLGGQLQHRGELL